MRAISRDLRTLFSVGAIGASGTLTIKKSIISGNTSTSNVGGIYFSGSVLTVKSSTLSGNTALGGPGGGWRGR